MLLPRERTDGSGIDDDKTEGLTTSTDSTLGDNHSLLQDVGKESDPAIAAQAYVCPLCGLHSDPPSNLNDNQLIGIDHLVAAGQPSLASQMMFQRIATPLTVGVLRQTRLVATQQIKAADSYGILEAQRKHRPTSPHLSIYRPQITWYLSILNRMTGAVLSGGFYVFGAAYLVSPLFGWHLDSATLAAAFGSLPLIAKLSLKSLVALPFTFHSINGLRHLVWDMGKQFTNAQVIRTGWTVVGLSTVSALVLAFFV